MTCTESMRELVECARAGSGNVGLIPGRDLRAHLADCTHCAERWDAERALSDQFAVMRTEAAALTAGSPWREARRKDLMGQFAALDFARQQRKSAARSWGLGLAAAAALVLAVFAGQVAGTHSRRATPALVAGAAPDSVQFSGEEFSGDATELSSDDFIAVPYTPPLAQGELVRVVHADLVPEALASLGIDVDPASSGNVPADVVVGEDGLPRAVRLTDGSQNDF
jgi:hypothetical protein